MTYGFEMNSAGPMKKSEIPPMTNPLIRNILVPCIKVYVIFIPGASRVYGCCTVRADICIHDCILEGAVQEKAYNCPKDTNPYTMHAWYNSLVP